MKSFYQSAIVDVLVRKISQHLIKIYEGEFSEVLLAKIYEYCVELPHSCLLMKQLKYASISVGSSPKYRFDIEFGGQLKFTREVFD